MIENLASQDLFFSIGVMIVVVAFMAYISKLLRQPMIPAYILTGILIGPLVFGFVRDMEFIRTLSEIGIAFLLFVVGLEIDLKKLKSVVWISAVGGIIQILLSFALGFFIGYFFGFGNIISIYFGLVTALSSTMVVVKLLSDNEGIATIHGKIILGILLVQDIAAIIALSLIGYMDSFTFSMNMLSSIGMIFVYGIALFAIAFAMHKLVYDRIFSFAARSGELLLLTALAICFMFSIFAYLMDFSIIIGAFVAGVSLASLPYNFDIVGRINPLKDFFSTIFFISLGMQLVLITKELVWPLIMIIFAVIFLKPLLIMVVVSLFGYKSRTSFFTGISLGQISEFSLVMVTLAFYYLGHLTKELFSLIVFATVITIVLTSYSIKNRNFLFEKLGFILKPFKKFEYVESNMDFSRSKQYDIILFGAGRLGHLLLKKLIRDKKSFVVVDNNPDIIKYLSIKGVHCIYGDIANKEVLEKVHLRNAKLVVSTVPLYEDNLFILKHVKSIKKKVKVFVTSNSADEALNLYDAGADYVMVQHILGGKKVGHIVNAVMSNHKGFISMKREHVRDLITLQKLSL